MLFQVDDVPVQLLVVHIVHKQPSPYNKVKFQNDFYFTITSFA